MNTQQLTNRLNEAIAYHKAGRYDRAEAIYRQVAPFAKTAGVYNLWGQLAEIQNRFEDAIQLYGNALRLDPTDVASGVRLAAVLLAVGRLADSEAILRHLLGKVPKSHDAWNALGFVLKLRGRLSDALGCHQRAVELNPKFVEGWCHMGLTFGSAGRNHEALKYYATALELDPNCWLARYGRAQSLHKIYRLDESLAEYDAVLKVQPQHAEARSFRLFALQSSATISRDQLFAEHVDYRKAVVAGPAKLTGYDLSPDRRIRVAIFSPDLRTHSCAYFLEPLLRNLDVGQFEIYLYHDHFVVDETSERLKQTAAVWRNFVGQPHHVVEQAIRRDKPDILIDLSGHIGNTVRLPLFAKRVAPVQIAYLGYPDTTGTPNMDFRFTDPIADPPGDSDKFATESLVRFAPTAWSYQPPLEAPDVAPLPGVAHRTPTFGCFNSPTKFTPTLYGCWAELLRRVPNSKLSLKGRDFQAGEVREYLLAQMREKGLPLDRLELIDRTAGTREHLELYSRVDIALDTFPYNGTTTTCEALWMGRPVVTLVGDRHAARVGASLLTAVGHPEWIGRDMAEYVDIATNLAKDLRGVDAHSAQLRDDMRKSVLLNHAAQAARFGAALRTCWKSKAAGDSFNHSGQRADAVAAASA